MSISHTLGRGLSAAAAAISLLAVAAPAQSAVIASFDPAFGPSIPNLGFRGTITLDVTAACYTLGSGFRFTGGACQITPLSAQVNFYNATSNSSNLSGVALAGNFFNAGYVFGAYFDPLTGQLSGLDTNDSPTFGVAVTDPNPLAPINYAGNMLLYFASGFANSQLGRIAAAEAAPSAIVPGVGGAFLVNCNAGNQRLCRSGDPTNTSNPARLTFTTVPEPDSIALALLGLGALVLTRRRASTPR